LFTIPAQQNTGVLLRQALKNIPSADQTCFDEGYTLTQNITSIFFLRAPFVQKANFYLNKENAV